MIMLIVAGIALVLRISIEQFMRFNMGKNQSDAVATLKLMSTAMENYARDNNGLYPESIQVLLEATPPYLDRDYVSAVPEKGYSFSCSVVTPKGYSCEGVPTRCALSGDMSYLVSTGGVLVSQKCTQEARE